MLQIYAARGAACSASATWCIATQDCKNPLFDCFWQLFVNYDCNHCCPPSLIQRFCFDRGAKVFLFRAPRARRPGSGRGKRGGKSRGKCREVGVDVGERKKRRLMYPWHNIESDLYDVSTGLGKSLEGLAGLVGKPRAGGKVPDTFRHTFLPAR